MKISHVLWQGLLFGALATGIATLALSKDKDRGEHAAVREALQRGEVLPLAKILEIATAKVPGEVIKVELELEGKKPKPGEERPPRVLVYEIKILTAEGRVRELEIDARNGNVLEVEDD